MKSILGLLAVSCALGLAGSGGDSGPVGTWELDPNGFFEANKDMFMAPVRPHVEQMQAMLKQHEQAMAALPPEQRAQVEARVRADALERAGENRDLAEAFLKSPADGMRLAEEKARRASTGLTMKIELKSDHTFVGSVGMGSDVDEALGTWALDGDKLTLTPKTNRAGQPLSGNAA